jgi:hypothetical protein
MSKLEHLQSKVNGLIRSLGNQISPNNDIAQDLMEQLEDAWDTFSFEASEIEDKYMELTEVKHEQKPAA